MQPQGFPLEFPLPTRNNPWATLLVPFPPRFGATGTAANFLRQTALVLEERSRSLATKNARLKDHFDASLVEIEVRQQAERDRQREGYRDRKRDTHRTHTERR